MALRDGDCGYADATMEHPLASKKQYISQKVSTSSKASIMIKAKRSYTCSDWRRNHNITGELMAWESPVLPSNVPMNTPSTTLLDNKKLTPRKKKGKGGVMNKNNDVFQKTSSLIVGNSQVSPEGKDVEKIHWEPPLEHTEPELQE